MKRQIVSLIAGLACTCAGLADTIRLKDGTTLEGKVTAETEDSYVVLYDRGGGIKDEKVIPKADVAGIDKAGPDEKAFKEIEDFVPTPDRLTAAQYADRIKKVKTFMDVYKTSKHFRAAKDILSKLEAEQKLAAGGGLKLDQRWISPQDREANAYEIDARVLFADMEDAVNTQKYHVALRRFEALEKEFEASSKYAEAVELAKQSLTAYKPQVTAMLAAVDRQTKEREVQMSRLPADQRQAAEGAFEARQAAYLKRVEAEKKGNATKWLTLNPYVKAPMEEVSRNIDSKLQDLNNISDEPKAAGPVYRDAWSAAKSGDAEQAKKLISELRSMNVPVRYIEPLEARLQPAEEPETSGTTTDPGDTPESATEEEKPEEEPAEKPEEKPEEEPETSASESESTPSTPSSSADSEEEEKGSPMKMILIIVMGLVIVGALVAAFGGKKK